MRVAVDSELASALSVDSAAARNRATDGRLEHVVARKADVLDWRRGFDSLQHQLHSTNGRARARGCKVRQRGDDGQRSDELSHHGERRQPLSVRHHHIAALVARCVVHVHGYVVRSELATLRLGAAISCKREGHGVSDRTTEARAAKPSLTAVIALVRHVRHALRLARSMAEEAHAVPLRRLIADEEGAASAGPAAIRAERRVERPQRESLVLRSSHEEEEERRRRSEEERSEERERRSWRGRVTERRTRSELARSPFYSPTAAHSLCSALHYMCCYAAQVVSLGGRAGRGRESAAEQRARPAGLKSPRRAVCAETSLGTAFWR